MSDLTARIVIDIPVKWDDRFKQQATFKRITANPRTLTIDKNYTLTAEFKVVISEFEYQ